MPGSPASWMPLALRSFQTKSPREARLIEPCVDGHIGIPGGQGVLGGDAGGGIGVRVGGVTTHILGAEGIAAGIDEFDAVGAWGKAGEEVGSRWRLWWWWRGWRRRRTEQVDGDACDAGGASSWMPLALRSFQTKSPREARARTLSVSLVGSWLVAPSVLVKRPAGMVFR